MHKWGRDLRDLEKKQGGKKFSMYYDHTQMGDWEWGAKKRGEGVVRAP